MEPLNIGGAIDSCSDDASHTDVLERRQAASTAATQPSTQECAPAETQDIDHLPNPQPLEHVPPQRRTTTSMNDRDIGKSRPSVTEWDGTNNWDLRKSGPPHAEWDINAKELELLISSKELHDLAKEVFDDPPYWETPSWRDHKYTMSRATLQTVLSNWKERYYVHLPSKKDALRKRKSKSGKVHTCKAHIGSVYRPFMRLIVAEFVLGWKVNYAWEASDTDDGKGLQVHDYVYSIFYAKKEQTTPHCSEDSLDDHSQQGGGKLGSQEKGKRKAMDLTDTTSDTTSRPAEKRMVENCGITGMPETNPGRIVNHGRGRANALGGGCQELPTSKRHDPTAVMAPPSHPSEDMDWRRSLGDDMAQFVQGLLQKYNLIPSETLEKASAKLRDEMVLLKAKLYDYSEEVRTLKSEMYDKSEEIRNLKIEAEKASLLGAEVIVLKRELEIVMKGK